MAGEALTAVVEEVATGAPTGEAAAEALMRAAGVVEVVTRLTTMTPDTLAAAAADIILAVIGWMIPIRRLIDL